MKRIHLMLAVFLLMLTLWQSDAALGGNLFVAPGGNGDGSSWDSPFGSIQEALNVSGVGDNIHVKQGTYNERIVMAEWIDLYGGYSGFLTGLDLSGREPATYVTSVSARGLSTPGPVVTGANSAAIDGFTLTGGQGDPDGGGMVNYLSSPTVANCVFAGNWAYGGGGMFNDHSSPVIINCIFSGNKVSYWGSGMSNFYSSPTITNCTFSGNTADTHGGGLFNWYSSPIVTNCIFWGDSGKIMAEIYDWSSTPMVTYCDVEDGYGAPEDNNIEQDPLLAGDLLPGGTWTQAPAYDPSSFETTFTDDLASWTEGALTGRLVNPNTLQERHFLIVTNTITTLIVSGDTTSLAGSGDSYELFDYRLQTDSPCIDAGTDKGGPGVDFEGDPRPQNCIYDMGADEFSVTTVDSDGDGFFDQGDNCPCSANPGQADLDGDGIGDVCDNCPNALNSDQTDTDEDGRGNVCDAELYIDKIVLKDLDNNMITEDFSPGTNIRYKVRFTVDGDPNKLYKVVVTGKAFSLFEPGGHPEWKDKFDSPKWKRSKLNGGESETLPWDRQIPGDATPLTRAKVKFTLKLKEHDQGTGAWNLLETYYGKKKFTIVP
jgi:hypothetical protein